MQTNPVANPLNTLTPPPATKGQQEDGPAFGQVLSREIADRRETESAQKPRDAQAGTPAQNKTTQGKTEQSTAKPSAEKSEESAQKTDKADKAESVEGAVAGVSAEMLALVNSLNLAATRTEKTAASGSTDLLASKGKRAEALLGVADKLNDMVQPGTKAASEEIQGTGRATERKVDTAAALVADAGEAPGLTAKPEAAFTAELQSALETSPNALQSLQQTAHVAAQTVTAQVTEHIAPRVGTPAWDQAIGQRVMWMVNGDQQTAELTLNPPDLGPLKVVLNVSNAQADATFTAAQPEVRQALEAAMPKLRDMLNEAGIQLGQANVNSGQPNQQNDADRQSARASNNQSGHGEGRDEAANMARVQPAATGRGLVDTFV